MQPGKMEQMVASVTGASQVRGALPESTTSIAPWRRSGVRYAANEIYIDLNERLDATVDGRNGVLQRAEVWGVNQVYDAIAVALQASRPKPHDRDGGRQWVYDLKAVARALRAPRLPLLGLPYPPTAQATCLCLSPPCRI